MDFGFAKDLTKSKRRADGQDRTFTKCGTPGYTAPEVLLQEEGSNIFDIYIDDGEKASSPSKTTFEMNHGISNTKLGASKGVL